jgi:hypothetical protein
MWMDMMLPVYAEAETLKYLPHIHILNLSIEKHINSECL